MFMLGCFDEEQQCDKRCCRDSWAVYCESFG